MKTDVTSSKLLDYFNGELSPEENRQLLQWRDSTEENQKLFDQVCKEHLALRWGARATKIEGDYTALENRISAKKRRLWTTTSAAAAVVVGVVGMLTMLRFYSDERVEIAQIPAPVSQAILELSDGSLIAIGNEDARFSEHGIEFSIESGELIYPEMEDSDVKDVLYNKVSLGRGTKPYRIALSDGSSVWLNSDSYLSYPVRFVGNERRIFLEGEAWFEVKRNEEKPFIVETALQEIRVLGTEFSVCAYEDDPTIRTTLISGSVQVTTLESATEIILAPGWQSLLNRETGETTIESVNIEDYTGWKDDMLIIEKLTMNEVLTRISRKFDVKFDASEVKIDGIVLRGSLHGDESLEIVLNALSKVIDVKFEMKQYGMIKVTD